MNEVVCQYLNGALVPYGDDDRAALKDNYKANQHVRCRITRIGTALVPSVEQNGLMHACFTLAADNTERQDLNTMEKVKFACKVYLDYRHLDRVAVRPDGTVVFEYRSFAFKELKNMERLNIFQRAFEWLSWISGNTVEELVNEAKGRMQRRRTT